MTTTYRLRLAVSLMLLLGFVPVASAQFAETWVTPTSKDCKSTPQTIRFHTLALKTGGTGTVDIDDDGRYEGITVATFTEDTDSDPIFETLASALSNTSAGGVIHLLPGVYREKVSIADSVIIRGSQEGDVIFQGACLASNGTAFDCTGSNETIVIENITILGYAVGINVYNNVVRVIDCRIAACGDGINTGTITDVVGTSINDCSSAGITGEIGILHVSDSVLQGNQWGIEYVAGGGGGTVTVVDSRILRNTNEGIKVDLSAGGLKVAVQGGEVSGNGGRGVSYKGRNTGHVRLSDVLISGNGSDGVYIENNEGCVSIGTVPVDAVAVGCRIMGNVGDGIELKTSGTGCGQIPSWARMSVFENSIAFNGAYGLNGNSVANAFVCTLGQNQISRNTTAAEQGTAVCTAAGSSSNHVP